MLPEYIKKQIFNENSAFSKIDESYFEIPKYDPKNHYMDVSKSAYYGALIVLRHYIKLISDYYFGSFIGAKNIDLFMMTSSVSSPMGPGSDSEPICIKFGKLKTFLVDSSQFGFEPVLLNGFDSVYCYLPSMRGEDPNARHLNQFFHCELEMVGDLDNLIEKVEGYIKTLSGGMLLMDNVIKRISKDQGATKRALKRIISIGKFPEITFDDAISILIKNNKKHLINFTKNGRDIKPEGEIELLRILGKNVPIWIKYFDRDRVPFYQKPNPKDNSKVINADLIFPPIIKGSFGGEIVGSGQRQDNVAELYESLKRQDVPSKNYNWYINLRNLPSYRTTSGFGMGIERFIAWVLCGNNIRDVILYPRLKNVRSYP